MNTLLATYKTPTGATLSLHYGGQFWTERKDEAGTTLVAVDARRAYEHYELAQDIGRVTNTFPVKWRGAA
jgi:hypothetical protein